MCRVIHEGMTCKQYQDDIKLKAQNDEDAKQTQAMIDVSSHSAFTCSRLTIETLEQSVKYVQS